MRYDTIFFNSSFKVYRMQRNKFFFFRKKTSEHFVETYDIADYIGYEDINFMCFPVGTSIDEMRSAVRKLKKINNQKEKSEEMELKKINE